MTASLYIHIPFCAQKCGYCDFYSVPLNFACRDFTRPGQADQTMFRYMDRLLRETEKQVAAYGVKKVPTLYIGGGTPSLLGAGGIGRLLEGLLPLLPERPQEISLEANPESISEDFLSAAAACGVNRLSLGIQSFHGVSRRLLRRMGSVDLLEKGLEMVSRHFSASFSVDLMAGLPEQDEALLREDIRRAMSYQPAHVSFYALTVEEGTPLAASLRREPALLPPADEADRLWLLGRDLLEKAGYAQYEVSNFALPGKECRHNLRYWRMENWLGIGPAASGTMIDEGQGRALRLSYPPDLGAWLSEGPLMPAAEALDRLTLMKESFLMGFRCSRGPDETLFRSRFGLSLGETIPQTLAKWRRKGLVQKEKAALTPEGLLFLDSFLIDAFTEAEGRVP